MARIRRSWPDCRSFEQSTAAPSMTCSQLSRTMSAWRLPMTAANDSMIETPDWARTSNASAVARGTPSGASI